VGALFDRVTILTLGGFTISACLTRAKVEARISPFLRARLGKRPRSFLLAIVFLSFLVSGSVTNTTAPLVLLPIILPLCQKLGVGNDYGKALLLALAFGCNIGGMATPVASPQNVVAFAMLNGAVSFGGWLTVAVPICTLCCLAVWGVLLAGLLRRCDFAAVIPVLSKSTAMVSEPLPPLTQRDMVALLACLTAVIAQVLSTRVLGALGDAGVVSLLLMAFVFGIGFLTLEDMQSYPWQLLVLLGGGSVLGVAVKSSGLLSYAVVVASPILPRGIFALSLLLSLLMLLVSTVVSHAVSALVLLPFIFTAGGSSPAPFVFTAVLCCSLAMALPVASLPNATVLLAEDEFGRHLLSSRDFVRVGLPVSVLCLALAATLGFVGSLAVSN